MNKQPVKYLQTDPRWKTLPYRVPGETATIGGSGCGPTAAAMIIETMTGQTFTPVDACKWSVDHGYKALNQGTYYSYFVPQFKAFGIDCYQALGSSLHNKPSHPIHDRVKALINEGYYAIALMGPGLWTSGGHYITVWNWDDKVRINDPASTKEARLNGDPELFKKQVKQYWMVDAREFNEDMTYEKFCEFMTQYNADLAMKQASEFAKSSIESCITNGIMVNTGTPEDPKIDRPCSYLTREEAAIISTQIMKAVADGLK